MAFCADDPPAKVFPIGDDLFVFPTTYKDSVLLHVRRFKKRGQTYYPTKEGLIMDHCWIEPMMDWLFQLPFVLREWFPPAQDVVNVNTVEHLVVLFKARVNGNPYSKCLDLSKTQWFNISNLRNDIALATLDTLYGSMDFYQAYKSHDGRLLEESLPPSLNASLVTQHLLHLLQESISDCVREEGGLEDPILFDGELFGNRLEAFISAAFRVRVEEIVESFYHKLYTSMDFPLLGQPAMYVTESFLRNVNLRLALNESKNTLCPSSMYESRSFWCTSPMYFVNELSYE